MVLQPTVHEDGVVQCNVISITHHDAPVGFVPISLLISLHWDNIKATKKRRVFRQALKSSRGWAEAGLRRPFWLHKSVSILFAKCKLYGNCVQRQNSWPTFLFFFVRVCWRHVAFGRNELATTLTTGIGNVLFYHLIFLWLANRTGFCQRWLGKCSEQIVLVRNWHPLCPGERLIVDGDTAHGHSQSSQHSRAQPQVCSGADLFEEHKT